MSECEHYQELISRMLDKDLSRNDVLAVMEHLDHCEECAAMYEAFNALSDAVAEDLVEPPEGLAENVMAEIRRKEIRDKNMRTKKQLKTIIAAAACVAVLIAIVGGFSIIKSSRNKNVMYESRVNVDKNSAAASSDDATVNSVVGETPKADENVLAPVVTDSSYTMPPIQFSETTKSSSATAYIVSPTPYYSNTQTDYSYYSQYQPTPTPNQTPTFVQTPAVIQTAAPTPAYGYGVTVIQQSTPIPVQTAAPTPVPVETAAPTPVFVQSAAAPAVTPVVETTPEPVNAIDYVAENYNDSEDFVKYFDLTAYDTSHFMSVITGDRAIEDEIGSAIAAVTAAAPAAGDTWYSVLPKDKAPVRADIFSYMDKGVVRQLEVRAYDDLVYLVCNDENGQPVCNVLPYSDEQYKALLVRYTLEEPEVSEAELEAQRIAEEQAAAEAQRIAEEQAAAEAQRIAEEQAAAEAQRIAEEQAAAEAQRIAEEQAAAAEKINAIETLGYAYNDKGENVTNAVDLSSYDTARVVSILKGEVAIEEEVGTDIASIAPDTLPSPEILPDGVERAWDDALPKDKNPVRADVLCYLDNNESKLLEVRIYDDFLYVIYNDADGNPVCEVAPFSLDQYSALMNKFFPGSVPASEVPSENTEVDIIDSNVQ